MWREERNTLRPLGILKNDFQFSAFLPPPLSSPRSVRWKSRGPVRLLCFVSTDVRRVLRDQEPPGILHGQGVQGPPGAGPAHLEANQQHCQLLPLHAEDRAAMCESQRQDPEHLLGVCPGRARDALAPAGGRGNPLPRHWQAGGLFQGSLFSQGPLMVHQTSWGDRLMSSVPEVVPPGLGERCVLEPSLTSRFWPFVSKPRLVS